MVDFNLLKREIKKFDGQEILISTIGKFSSIIGIECCKIMNSVNKREFINIVNMGCLLDGIESPVNIVINEEDVLDYEVLECNGNSEVLVKWNNGESIIIIGC